MSTNSGDGESSTRTVPWATTAPSYVSDPKYKKYTQQVEKCLSSFDNVHEWADFISFLKQLLKTLQAYMQFKEIPRKLIVAKRLSQCLNPALPTGVHQRALDVYAHILAVLGSEGLRRDLALWSSGLFPFFEYAATSVKPILLNIFDTHYLPLQSGLRPAMKSFILALLPGLEEETGEFFDKVISLLDRLSGTVSQSFFLQNMWLVMLTSSSTRGTSLAYLTRRLPNMKVDDDITVIVGKDIGLMIRAFAAALEDDDLLVRRASLDLLHQSLKVDSRAVKEATDIDRAILMRAATSVVLRRDLSLNRRLYSWLLGPEENSSQQLEYFLGNALGLLTATLKEDMFNPSPDYTPSRPFKIFISLLDKWEVGSPLTAALILDVFRALRRAIEAGTDPGEDMSMTASTLYEAVEPHALWKQLLNAVLVDIFAEQDQTENIHMVRHILLVYHSHDEEIETIHLPIVFAAIVETLQLSLHSNPLRISFASVREALGLLHEIWKHIRLSYLKQHPQVANKQKELGANGGLYAFACAFYGNTVRPLRPEVQHIHSVPLVAIFHYFIGLTTIFSQELLATPAKIPLVREALISSLVLITRFAEQFQQLSDSSVTINWNPDAWLQIVLKCMESKVAAFSIVDHTVSAIIKLQDATNLYPQLSTKDRFIVSAMIKPLLKYLGPSWSAYHLRAANLIWSIEGSSSRSQVVSIISQSLNNDDIQQVREAYEAFGALWRLTDDAIMPGFRLKIPMMTVLDSLKSEDPNLRRIGETWMRCNLRSYVRVLDPLLFDLCDPDIRRSSCIIEVNGKSTPGFHYDKPFDQRYTNHILGLLLSVMKFGGHGFMKVARSTLISRSMSSGLLERVQKAGMKITGASYLDVIITILLLFLQSEPNANLPVVQPYNLLLQSAAIDLLQAIVSRGETDAVALQTIENAIVGKLYLCVHSVRLDIQNKLLHLLHSILSAFNSQEESRGTAITSTIDSTFQRDNIKAAEASPKGSYTINTSLVPTIMDGISKASNRPLLQHWLDFVLTTLPQFSQLLEPAIIPLSDCICQQLRLTVATIIEASYKSPIQGDSTVYTTDADIMMLLNAVERMVLLSLSQLVEPNQPDDDAFAEKPTNEGTGFLGYVSNVFSSDPVQGALDDPNTSKANDYRCLQEAVHVLFAVWEQMIVPSDGHWGSQEESLTLIHNRARTRCRRALEHLFRAYPLEVLESVVDCWSQENPHDGTAAFELIDILSSSAQNVVHMVCESISIRTPGFPERTKKHGLCPTLMDVTLFDFLEQYLKRLEGPLAVQVWSRFLQLAKDMSTAFREFRLQTFLTLRCFTILADKLTNTPATEDRRIRKELQDAYTRLVDTCLLAGRSYDQTPWTRRAQSKVALNGRDRDSSLPRVNSDSRLDEKIKRNTSNTSLSLPDSAKPVVGTDLIQQINLYLAIDVVPSLRKFLADNDKVLSVCSNIVSMIVNPAVKGKARPLDVDKTVLSVLREMTRIAVALKAWRGPVVDVLNDNRCFNSSPTSGENWRPLVKMLFETDKTALTELLSKITTAPSANIFTNREYEMLLRSLNLRRLSYVLLSGEKNQFLTQLPTIQEKLVDTLRNVTAPIVQSEVYLCVRVLLCRLSPHNLSSFWPVILTELFRVFEQLLTTLPPDGSEELGLILSSSKLLDLLLVLQTEEFQIHQWMFITDTVDSVYRQDEWMATALLDRLTEVVGALPSEGETKHQEHGSGLELSVGEGRRRPILNGMHQIDSIRDLVPFFSQASIASFESIYKSDGVIDWNAVEEGLFYDMFDGR